MDRFEEFLHELQQLERTAMPSQASAILDVFLRHTPFGVGAVYVRDGDGMRLAAKSQQCVAPEILDGTGSQLLVEPRPHVILPLKSQQEDFGLLAFAPGDRDASEEEVALARAAATIVSTMLTNQRLLQDAREGDFQLKYRLWELESLYDIGLSIAGTLNIEELADEILFRMISLTNARRAALYLREGDKFVLYRSFGEVRDEFLDEEITSRLMAESVPLSFEEGTDCIFPGCSAFVAVPIRGNSAVVGVLAAADRETREGAVGAFMPHELRLLGSYASQAAIAIENARLHREALDKQALERDLELAATIQKNILPKKVPDVEGIELATLSRPARQVGGDYHVFFERDGILTLLIADVAGKSVPAALLVSALHAAVQLLVAEGRELGSIATDLNRHIHSWSAENKFITMIVASIDREAGTIQYVNAGHNPAYIVSPEGLDMIKSNGLPIGILAQTRYTTLRRPFPPGATLVLYSDGITEAENAAGDEFGNEALEALLRAHPGATAEELRDRIAAAVDAFVADAPQKDDETLVIAKRA